MANPLQPVAIAIAALIAAAVLPADDAAAQARRAVSATPTESGAVVTVGDAPFVTYVADHPHQPAVWPIHGPNGRPMTRSWPLGPRRAGEATDHPHHLSLWLAHGDVNGHDFWHPHQNTIGGEAPRIVHQRFAAIGRSGADPAVAVVETENAWTADGVAVLFDRRRLSFGLVDPERADSPRYVDMDVSLSPANESVVFGDTKEGSFAVRVPGPMKVDAGLGGTAVNSRGQTNGGAWGRPAEWVAYAGPLEPPSDADARPAAGGVVVMSHPGSFRPTPRWHVREYGLFAANPFGDSDFPPETPRQGAVTVERGDTLALHYRVVFYSGEASSAQWSAWFDAYAATPR